MASITSPFHLTAVPGEFHAVNQPRVPLTGTGTRLRAELAHRLTIGKLTLLFLLPLVLALVPPLLCFRLEDWGW